MRDEMTQSFFIIFHFVLFLFFYPYECPVLCQHRPGHSLGKKVQIDKLTFKVILSSKDMNKYLIRPLLSAKSTIRCFFLSFFFVFPKKIAQNSFTQFEYFFFGDNYFCSTLFTKQSVKWRRRFNRIL